GGWASCWLKTVIQGSPNSVLPDGSGQSRYRSLSRCHLVILASICNAASLTIRLLTTGRRASPGAGSFREERPRAHRADCCRADCFCSGMALPVTGTIDAVSTAPRAVGCVRPWAGQVNNSVAHQAGLLSMAEVFLPGGAARAAGRPHVLAEDEVRT